MTFDDMRWERYYQAAKEYREAYGSLLVPMAFVSKSGIRLGSWILRQRRDYKLGRVSPERQRRLDMLGMVWENDGWQMRYELVRRYRCEHGTSDIPRSVVVDGISVGKWIVLQRHLYAQGNLTPERMALMDRLETDPTAAMDR